MKIFRQITIMFILMGFTIGETNAQSPIHRDRAVTYPQSPGDLSYGTRRNILTRGNGYSTVNNGVDNNWYYQDGGTINLSLQFLDLDWGIIDMDNGAYYFNYNFGIGLRFGNYKDPLQFEFGFMPGYITCCNNEGYYYYDDGLSGFHMPMYGKLKIGIGELGNLGTLGSSRWYVSPALYYNVARQKEFERAFAVGIGFGFQTRNLDWQILKCKIPFGPRAQWSFIEEYSPKVFFGTTLAYYLPIF